MLVQTKVGTAQPSEGFAIQSREYSVDSPALVFDVLCNRMYNKPLHTMIQEYLANARDAHREVGVEETVPVQVTLPTDLEPYLIIRDFGPGLTEQRIDEVFIRLGASTKNMDDLMTGGFGLGAKIGWAYNDSFFVISVVNGVKSTYLAYRDESGIGRMDTISVDTTDEPNGVAIKVMIKEHHRGKVFDIISRVTYFWKLAPVAVDYERQFTHCEEDDRVNDLYYGSVFFSSGGVLAVVDGIPYSVDSNNVAILGRLRLASGKTLCLFFDVGEIEVAINREGIKYSPRTIQNITHTVQSVMDSNAAAVTAAADISSYVGKLRALRKCYTRLGAPKQTVVMLQPLLGLRFLYSAPDGVLSLVCARGCRSFSTTFSHNGKVRDTVQYNTKSIANVQLRADGTLLDDLDGRSISFKVDNSGRLIGSSTYDDGISYICMLPPESSVSDVVSLYKAKFRTLVEKYKGGVTVIFTENWNAYNFLVSNVGLRPVYDLEDTHYKRQGSSGDRGCNFTEVDVKDVRDRNTTKKLGAMDMQADMWCQFKERNDVLGRFKFANKVLPEFAGRTCWYVTAEQIPIIKDIGIQHYTDVYNKAKARMVPNLYGTIVSAIAAYDDMKLCIDAVLASRVFYNGSIYLMLLNNMHLFSEEHLLTRYIRALAKSVCFDIYSSVLRVAYDRMSNYVEAIYRIERKKIRSMKGVDLMRHNILKEARRLENEVNEAYPLLAYLINDFQKSRKQNNEEQAVIDHVLQYLLGKC